MGLHCEGSQNACVHEGFLVLAFLGLLSLLYAYFRFVQDNALDLDLENTMDCPGEIDVFDFADGREGVRIEL